MNEKNILQAMTGGVGINKRGQAMVEFMLVLPVLLLLTLGIVEFGRMFAIYAMVTSASREASRYGASVGDNGSGLPRYLDCAGMREAARRVAVLSEIPDADITITYDEGDSSTVIGTCDSGPNPADIALGDRVLVQVEAAYAPIVPLIAIPEQILVATSARSILKEIDAGPTATVGGPAATATASPTLDPSITPTITPTPSSTPTATATFTVTPGPSLTPTETYTPFPTPTAIPAPQNFTATAICSSRKVTFNWSPVPGVDHYEIYRSDPPPTVMIVIDSNPSCNNCDLLPDGVDSRTYYVVAVVGSHRSAPSNVSTASCGG